MACRQSYRQDSEAHRRTTAQSQRRFCLSAAESEIIPRPGVAHCLVISRQGLGAILQRGPRRPSWLLAASLKEPHSPSTEDRATGIMPRVNTRASVHRACPKRQGLVG